MRTERNTQRGSLRVRDVVVSGSPYIGITAWVSYDDAQPRLVSIDALAVHPEQGDGITCPDCRIIRSIYTPDCPRCTTHVPEPR